MAKKPIITTTVTVHGVNGTVIFADAITDKKTTRDGSNARDQILRGETIEANADGTLMVIPYHAVVKAEVTETEGTYTKPEDDFCVSN